MVDDFSLTILSPENLKESQEQFSSLISTVINIHTTKLYLFSTI